MIDDREASGNRFVFLGDVKNESGLREGLIQRARDQPDVANFDIVGSNAGGGIAGYFERILAVDERARRKLEKQHRVFFILEEHREFFLVEADVPSLFHIALAEAEGLFCLVFHGHELENVFVRLRLGGEFIPFDFLARANVMELGIKHLREAASGLNQKADQQNQGKSHDNSVTTFPAQTASGREM